MRSELRGSGQISKLEVYLDCAEGKSVVTSKWIYRIWHATSGKIDKYKEKIEKRRFSQKEGEDHDKKFAPVVRYTYVRNIAL